MTDMQKNMIEVVINKLVFTDKLDKVVTEPLDNGDMITTISFEKAGYYYPMNRMYHFIVSKKGNLYFYNKNRNKQYISVWDVYTKCEL